MSLGDFWQNNNFWSRAKTACFAALPLSAVYLGSAQSAHAGTLEEIKLRGKLLCSVPTSDFYGFSETDSTGTWKGMDVEICKAIATAILGPGDNVTFVPNTWQQRFASLQVGNVDLLPSTTQTLTRDTALGLQFSLPYYHASNQFIARTDGKIHAAKDLEGGTLCTTAGTSAGQVAFSYLSGLGVHFSSISYDTTLLAQQSYLAGRCDAFGGFGPALAAMRVHLAKNPNDHVILPDLTSDEPTAFAMMEGDKKLLNIVDYTISALVDAEELGVTAQNATTMKAQNPSDPRIATLLGVTKFAGDKLEIRESWAYDAIRLVGNYGEIYDRNLGKNSSLQLERGLNKLWKEGGMLFPIPLI